MKKYFGHPNFFGHLEGQCDKYSDFDRSEYVVSKKIGREKAIKITAEWFEKEGFPYFTDVTNDCPNKMSIVRDGNYNFVGFRFSPWGSKPSGSKPWGSRPLGSKVLWKRRNPKTQEKPRRGFFESSGI